MNTTKISGINTTSYEEMLTFENKTQVGVWAKINNSTQNITVSNIPIEFTGLSVTIYANASISQSDDPILTPINVVVLNQSPYVNTSYTELQYLTDILFTFRKFDITNLFIDPEGQDMTYSISLQDGEYYLI